MPVAPQPAHADSPGTMSPGRADEQRQSPHTLARQAALERAEYTRPLMRILTLTHYWHPHRGGIETVALEQTRRLAARGHRVTVVTSRLPGDPPDGETDGVRVLRVPAFNQLERFGIPYPVFSGSLVMLLRRLVPEHDVVIAHSHTFLTSVAGAFVASRARRPLLLLQHNSFVEYKFPWNVVERGADRLLGRYSLGAADRVLAVSNYSARYVRELVPEATVDVLWNGVDTRRFTPVTSPDEQARIRADLGLPADAFIVFTVRRLVFKNGIGALLEACARLKGRPSIEVVIGGTGPDRAQLEEFIAREGLTNVRLAGFVTDERLPDYYRAANVFVLPALTGEGLPMVLLEAFASGIPAIATRAGGQEDIVIDGQTGLLVPPGSPAALADAIEAWAWQPDAVREMGATARAMALDMDWELQVDRLEAMLAALGPREAARA